MSETSVDGWRIDVERKSGWLVVRPQMSGDVRSDEPNIAEPVWQLLEKNHGFRLVLDMEEIPMMPSLMIGQLIQLQKRVEASGGAMRLIGMSEGNREVLRICRLDRNFPHYASREEAVTAREQASGG